MTKTKIRTTPSYLVAVLVIIGFGFGYIVIIWFNTMTSSGKSFGFSPVLVWVTVLFLHAILRLWNNISHNQHHTQTSSGFSFRLLWFM